MTRVDARLEALGLGLPSPSGRCVCMAVRHAHSIGPVAASSWNCACPRRASKSPEPCTRLRSKHNLSDPPVALTCTFLIHKYVLLKPRLRRIRLSPFVQ